MLFFKIICIFCFCERELLYKIEKKEDIKVMFFFYVFNLVSNCFNIIIKGNN